MKISGRAGSDNHSVGLRELAKDLNNHGMRFYYVDDTPEKLIDIVKENNIGAIVTDFFPLRKLRSWEDSLARQLPSDVPYIQVDAHNIVPVWVASNREETAARTMRPKLQKLLPQYLVEFPALETRNVSTYVLKGLENVRCSQVRKYLLTRCFRIQT